MGDKPLIVRDGKGVDPVTGAEATLPDTAEDIMNNNACAARLTLRWLPEAAVTGRHRAP